MYCTAGEGRGASIAGSEKALYVGTGGVGQVKEVIANLRKLVLDKQPALSIMEARYIYVYILFSIF
jgi:hypothetical protein